MLEVVSVLCFNMACAVCLTSHWPIEVYPLRYTNYDPISFEIYRLEGLNPNPVMFGGGEGPSPPMGTTQGIDQGLDSQTFYEGSYLTRKF